MAGSNLTPDIDPATLSYPAFVSSRVKWFATYQLDILHACVGICGECIEYSQAKSKENQWEELGDLCFYAEHLLQAWERWNLPMDGKFYEGRESYSGDAPLVWLGGDILDSAKKIWVYNKPPSETPLINQLSELRKALRFLVRGLGKTRVECERANQEKLILRYPTGYSDAAAQARADKPQGE